MHRLITIFKIPELRTKILFTLGLLMIYRLGFWVPLPIIDQESMRQWAQNTLSKDWNKLLSTVSMFSGTDIGNATIFGLGIMPYISASIIFQLLASVVPALEKLQKEGEVGRKKINEYTRYAAVGICLIQSWMWVNLMMGQRAGGADSPPLVAQQYHTFFYHLISVCIMTAGTIFLMWIGEQIDEYGIGNGISLIIMAGIVGRMPRAISELANQMKEFTIAPQTGIGVDKLLVLACLFIGVIIVVIYITQGQRRIPTQSAKHVRGRRVFGGNRQYLPLKVNQAGVMPIIFASSLLMFPTFILAAITGTSWGGRWEWAQVLLNSFRGHGYIYNVCYVGLIYFFCYFWTAISFNPKDMANNLKDYGSFIPGYRPGKRTADYLERVMLRITYVGSAFLAVIAVIPTLVAEWLDVHYTVASFFGGTGLLIMISVAMDLIQKIDSHLIMRNYDSLLGPSH